MEGVTVETVEEWLNSYFWVGEVPREDGILEFIYTPISKEGRELIDTFYDNYPFEDRPFSCEDCIVDIYKDEKDKSPEEKEDKFCIVFRKNSFRVAAKSKEEDWLKTMVKILGVMGVIKFNTPRDKTISTKL